MKTAEKKVRTILEETAMLGTPIRNAAEKEKYLVAVMEEAEVPGPMPDKMWAMLNGNRDLSEQAIRIAIREAKVRIMARIMSL